MAEADKAPGTAIVEAIAALALGAAILAAWTGGWRLELFGLTLSVRSIVRPVTMAGVLLVARWSTMRAPLRLFEVSQSIARVYAGALVATAVLGWITHVSPYIGGADSYGYVSAAQRIRAGELIQIERVATLLPYPERILPATPLGYTPSTTVQDATVPVYPLGLPALMALAQMTGSQAAVFAIAPLFGLVLVTVCGVLVYRWRQDAAVALAAAAAIAFHPVVFAYSIQPMSDVPAAAFYSLAVALLLRSSPGAAGAAGGVAFLIRPALLPAVAALLLVILARREQRTAFVPFTAALALFVAAQAGIQWHLYGSPLASGYGANLFGLSNLLANVRSYGEWIPKTHGLIWFIGGAIGLLAIRSLQAYAAIVATLIGAVVPYAVYRTFDHWETQRFILPFLIACTLTAVAGLFHISQRWLPRAGAWIALALTTGMIFGWTRWLDQQRVLQLALSEERYSQAAQLVDRVTPGNAVVLTSLHSGSIRYYARRDTLDWAKIPPDKLELTVTALREHARPVYVLLDGEEERTEFVARHGVVPMQRWLPAGQRRNVRLYEVRSEK